MYVFYDITDRPVYVGKSNTSIRGRVKDHQTRFWFKYPLVVKGAFLNVADRELCGMLEMVLIKFLGKHALLNEKGVARDIEEAFEEDSARNSGTRNNNPTALHAAELREIPEE